LAPDYTYTIHHLFERVKRRDATDVLREVGGMGTITMRSPWIRGDTNLENYLNELAGDPVPGVGVHGDLTGDDQVTLADLRLLIQMLVGQAAPTDAAKVLAAPTDQLTLADARTLITLLVTP
jgi:hypothetical protein